jgi:hypothetical protein
MKFTRSRSGSKRPREKGKDLPRKGIAGPGETFDPMRSADDRKSEEPSPGEPRSAPAPGVPVSSEHYDWLKRKAKTVRPPSSKHGQEDPSGKKQK